jgi:hypothetical protein
MTASGVRNIDFSLKPTDGEAFGCFWKVYPLADALNENHGRTKDGFQAGWKLFVDESMSSWKGHDQRHEAIDSPHVTKITRNVMLKLEILWQTRRRLLGLERRLEGQDH